ncbi:nucleotide sugar dehydrogenase [Pyrobaculum neutrophilum]|uniref:UDP-N-acetyl-D-mannosamine dehydrogenase n=1 Tax=Pyrobaculum neutrophilum (strain DSM 2338 / JCM 9278 / NBRC 100436 / V24Sta) TaxID=444157 RepID=B1Y9M5_PYRNV|nr:nucleotide sugar dehydrogenase [Pyrobaculum neutrophilum]ACB40454.1 nucleotide sugar dehydrogenase [Pyrobaculum neutrophilum V24Sta]
MLADLLRRGELTVSIYGLGYVGLALSAAWAQAGAKVIGVDVNPAKVEKINAGRVEYPEDDVVKVLTEATRGGRFTATTDGVVASLRSQVKIVAVPVYLKKSPTSVEVDFTALTSAARAIGAGLKKGDLVIVESSVPPGATEDVVRPVLEGVSGLVAEEDFYLAYSPERIMVGHALKDIVENYPKVVAGVGPRSAEEAAELYRQVAKRGVVVLNSTREAEFEKLLEGVYRDVNIALANEMAKLANALGISFRRAREAANSQPYSHVHKPGTGVGGNCIPVYPYFLMWSAARLGIELPLTRLARQINERQPEEVAFAALRAMLKRGVNPASARIAILGLAFRGDIDDTRESPTYGVVATLLKLGIRPEQIVVHDPYVKQDSKLAEWGVALVNELEAALRGADLALVATDHSTYRIEASKIAKLMKTPLIVDARGVLIPDVDIYAIDSGAWP